MSDAKWRIALATSLSCVALSLSVQAQTPSPAGHPTAGRVTFADSIKEVTARPTQLGRSAEPHATLVRSELTSAETQARLDFSVALKFRNVAGLQARVAKGETISLKEMSEKYFPTAADYDRVREWLVAQGFQVKPANNHNLSIFASGSIAQIERAFATKFGRIGFAGAEYSSAVSAPSLPESVASAVLSINGLQPHLQPTVHSRRLPVQLQKLTSNRPPYTVPEIVKAYDVPAGDGTGQKIGIVIDTFPADSDLTSFWTGNGTNQSLANIEKVQVVQGILPSPSGEETLDVEWSSGMAPGAKVRVYATTDLSFVHLDQAYQQIINELPNQPELHQISLSYGLGETYAPQGEMQTDANYFLSLAGSGVSVFVAAGDGGSRPGTTGHDHSGPVQTETPSNDPSVTAVGGTSLYTDPSSGVVSSESAWFDGGGGVSGVFSRPTWQSGSGVPSGTGRLVPDVALVADPQTGGYVILNGQLWQFGGTSWSSPTWAAICARINQIRAGGGNSPVGLFGPKLYPLLGTNNFRDITTGSNGSNGVYNAGTGYDLCTGIGVPDVAHLTQSLASAGGLGRMDKDFNHDGQADVLWQDTNTGQIVIWCMKKGVFSSSVVLNGAPPPWRVAGAGDFNGDGYADVVWENTATGQHLIWFLKNGVYTAGRALPSLPTYWKIAGVGDFNGDGNADLLLENTATGDHSIWLLKDGVYSGNYLYLGRVPTEWRAAGAADFLGNGQTDIVWDNTVTGGHFIWILNKGTYVRSIGLPQTSLQWRIAGGADFNGDGQADIVWNNTTTGQHGIWLMKAGVPSGWVSLPGYSTDWQITEH